MHSGAGAATSQTPPIRTSRRLRSHWWPGVRLAAICLGPTWIASPSELDPGCP